MAELSALARLLAVLAIGAAGAAASAVLPGAVTLSNSNGVRVKIIPVGACVQSLLVPDRDGVLEDVMLGFDNQDQYKNRTSVSGCVVGRVGGLISGASFKLLGKTYKLDANSNKGKDTLHGGGVIYSQRPWTVVYASDAKAKLKLDSPDGDQGFPGALSVRVTYKLTEDNELITDITATTTKSTPINLFNHPYLNLAGFSRPNSTVLDHLLTVHDGDYYVGNVKGLPTGKLEPVNGTALDFTEPHTIGERIATLVDDGGYSTSYVLFGNGGGGQIKKQVKGFEGADPADFAATLVHPGSGRGLDILTTASNLMLYTGNSLSGKFTGKGGLAYQKWGAVALETTTFPNAINQPKFPSNVLRPGDQFRQTTVWRLFKASPDGREDGTLRSCGAAFPGCKTCKKLLAGCTACKDTYKLSKGKCVPKKSLRRMR